ncbi:kinase-like domain-containing protein [Aspergillus venezuelensis]
MSSAMIRTTIRDILAALDFLHTEAEVIYTDIQPNNILLGIKNESILADFEQAGVEAPMPRKTLEDRTIYVTRPLPISYGTPVLCDLGKGRIGTGNQRGDIMPDLYRAPEVDIWNVGMVIWDLFEHHHLFRARYEDRRLNDEIHLAEMHAVLRKPPEFLARSKALFFGMGMGSIPLPNCTLETLEERLKGKEQENFLRLLRRMLCWRPEQRATVKQLIFDPWLMQGLFK